MDKDERIDNFKQWIADGNELTIEDMLAVIVGHLSIDKVNNFDTKLFVAGNVYNITITSDRVN